MQYTDFSELNRFHSEWSRMEKAVKTGWLSGDKARLTRLVIQFSQYIYKGGIMNETEIANIRKHHEMINPVDAKGAMVRDELSSDTLKRDSQKFNV